MSERLPSATWRLLGLELALDEPEQRLREHAAQLVGLDVEELRGFRIARKALDMRQRGGARRLRFVCHVDVVMEAGRRTGALARAEKAGRARLAPEMGSIEVLGRRRGDASRVVVVGAGPAGLFAALVLARNGAQVTLLERGPAVR